MHSVRHHSCAQSTYTASAKPMMDLPTVPEPNVELSLQNFMSVSIAASAHADALATPYDDGVSFDLKKEASSDALDRL